MNHSRSSRRRKSRQGQNLGGRHQLPRSRSKVRRRDRDESLHTLSVLVVREGMKLENMTGDVQESTVQ